MLCDVHSIRKRARTK